MTDQSQDIFAASAETQPAAQQTAEQPATQAPATSTSPDDLFREQLASIRNEEGLQKYASVTDALNSVTHSQEFIKTLKAEKAALEQQYMEAKLELEKRMSVEDAMSKIASTPKAEPTAQDVRLSRDDVYSIMKEYETTKSFESNRKSVNDTLVKHYGDAAKAQAALTSKLADLGMTREEIASLASKSPRAAYQLLGLDSKAPAAVNKSVASDINADAIESSMNREIPKSKGIMIGANTKDLIAEWRNSGAIVQ